jgi:hypothetical protein
MAVFCPLSTQPVIWQDALQIGALVTFYDAGTLTPRSCWADGLLTAPYAQPVLSDGNGCIPNVWVSGTNSYKVRILASTGVQIREVDNLPGDVAGLAPPPPPPAGTITLNTGDLVWSYTTAIVPGRVRANGKTIGNATSGGSEFADPSAQNLFQFLWNADAKLVVIGGRGLSAINDWNANKAISLPDVNGRTVVGIDGMGSTPSNRLAGISFAIGDAHSLGSTGGAALHVMAPAELVPHTHTATTQAAGQHQHQGTTDVSAAAAVNAVTDTQGSHSHTGATVGSGNFGAAGGTDSQVVHSHGGITASENQSHSHGYATISSFSIGAPGSSTQYWYGAAITGTTTGESNSHQHGISNDGLHSHNVSVTVPNHTHGIVADGAHAHNVTVPLIAHTHTFTTAPAGQHSHTLVTDDIMPAAQAFDVTQPFITMTAYLVL